MGGRGCAGWSGVKGGKWDNCNSIINKIYFKKTINGSTMKSRKKSKDTLKQMKIRTQQSTILLGHWEINNTLGTGKAILREKFIALQAYLQ